MKKLIPFVIIALFFSIAIARLDNIEIYAGENKTLSFIIVNEYNKTRTYNIYLTGPVAYFAERKVLIDVYPKIVTLEPNQSSKINLYIYSSKESKEISPHLFLLTISSEDYKIEREITVSVSRKYPVYISSINLSKYSILPLESTRISITIQNAKNYITPNYKVVFSILKDGKEVLRKEVITDFIEANSRIEVSQEFFAEKYQEAGIYDVNVKLEDLKGNYIDEAKTKFEVKAIVKLPQEYTTKEIKYSLLSTLILIKVKNEGNTVSNQFYVEERVPRFMKDFVKARTPFKEVIVENGNVVYRWLVKPLAPGESVIVEYEISLWQVWLALIAILLAVIYFFRRGFKPSLLKTVKREGEKFKIYIKLRNNSKSTMKDVEVVEEVPPMLKVESGIGLGFEERKIGKKRYLIWTIKEVKPDEEVIMGYIASPLVEIISLDLPKTKATFIDEKGIKKTLE
jgi:hypothetical protein